MSCSQARVLFAAQDLCGSAVAQVQDPGGSCHGGYMAQQRYLGASAQDCSQAYDAVLAMNCGGAGSGGDYRPSSSSTASEVANFAWGDVCEPHSCDYLLHAFIFCHNRSRFVLRFCAFYQSSFTL